MCIRDRIRNPNGEGTVTSVNVAAGKLVANVSASSPGTPVTANGRLARAGWNLAMLASKSAVVHNPTLTFQALTVSALKVVDPAAGAL